MAEMCGRKVVGAWEIGYSTDRAVLRGVGKRTSGKSFTSGVYVPGRRGGRPGLDWDPAVPINPAFEAEVAVTKARRDAGLPI